MIWLKYVLLLLVILFWLCFVIFSFEMLEYFLKFIYLFLAACGLSRCGGWALLCSVVLGFLLAAASLLAELGL